MSCTYLLGVLDAAPTVIRGHSGLVATATVTRDGTAVPVMARTDAAINALSRCAVDSTVCLMGEPTGVAWLPPGADSPVTYFSMTDVASAYA